MTRRRLITGTALAILVLASPGAGANLLAPARAPNLAPHQLVFLQPPPEPARMETKRFTAGVQLAYASVFTEADPAAQAVIDLEAARLAVRGGLRIGDRMDLSVEVPVLWTGGGWFDPFLIAYHEFWGLPDGGRPDAPRNEYRYRVRTPDGVYQPDGDGRTGVGDVVATARLSLAAGRAGAAAVRLSAKLPTGDPGRGFGSGSADAGIGLLGQVDAGRFSAFANLDAVYLGGTPDDALPLNTRWVGSALLGGGVELVREVFGLVAQVQLRSSPYNTGWAALDRDVAMLAVAGRLAFGDGWSWTAGFTEDLAVHASPDFSVFTGLDVTWGAPAR